MYEDCIEGRVVRYELWVKLPEGNALYAMGSLETLIAKQQDLCGRGIIIKADITRSKIDLGTAMTEMAMMPEVVDIYAGSEWTGGKEE